MADDLIIPQAAVDAWFVCGCSESGVRAGYQSEALYAVVAAELRRLATNEFSGNASSHARQTLRARADELDPQPAVSAAEREEG